MKKRVVVVFLTMVLLAVAKLTFAGGSDGSNSNRLGQEQGQTLINAPTSISTGNIGSWLHPSGMQELSPPIIPFNKYERQVNDLPSPYIIKVLQRINGANFSLFESEIEKLNGEGFLKKLRKNVRLRPTIIQKFSAAPEIILVEDLPMDSQIQTVGFLTGDAILDKDHLVYRQELTMYIGEQARREYGANVMVWVPQGDAFRTMLLAKSYGFGLSGVLGSILLGGANPVALAGSPQGSFQQGSNVMYGDAGTVYALFRVNNPEELLNRPVKPQTPVASCEHLRIKIEDLLRKRDACTRLCFDNMATNLELGDAYALMAKCSGDSSYLAKADEAYARAEKNYLQGYDIKKHRSEAEKIVAQVYDHWSYVVFKLRGDETASRFAYEHHLENGYVTDIK